MASNTRNRHHIFSITTPAYKNKETNNHIFIKYFIFFVIYGIVAFAKFKRPECTLEQLNFQNFRGSMPPDPLVGRTVAAPYGRYHAHSSPSALLTSTATSFQKENPEANDGIPKYSKRLWKA